MGEISQQELANEVLRTVSKAAPVLHGEPTATLIMGGVAAGKTTLRRRSYSTGYVLIDAAEIFRNLSPEPNLDFPDALLDPMHQVGSTTALQALSERRPIVTEIIGDDQARTHALIAALKSIGYRVHVDGVTCDAEEAIARNLAREHDNISSYYAEHFQLDWLTSACEKIRSRKSSEHNCSRECTSIFVQRVYEDSDYLLFKKDGLFGIKHPFFSSFHIQVKGAEVVVEATGKEKRFLLAILGEMATLGQPPHAVQEGVIFRDFSAAVSARGGVLWQAFFAGSSSKELARRYATT